MGLGDDVGGCGVDGGEIFFGGGVGLGLSIRGFKGQAGLGLVGFLW